MPKSEHRVDLRKIPLFAHLSEDELRMVEANFRVRAVARRETVLQKGGKADGLLLLLAGNLQVTDITQDGRVIALRALVAGDFFGEIALINDTTRSASVVALGKAVVGFLPSATTLHLFSHAPSVTMYMLRHLASKIQRDSEIRSLLSIHSTSKRIYTFLSLRIQVAAGGQEVVEHLPAHHDIANMINTSRETVTRALRFLIQQGIAEKDAHRLVILNPAALRRLAQQEA